MTEKAEPKDDELLERIAEWIAKRRLTAPAIIFLETHRPLSFVGSQAMIAATPVVSFFEPLLQALTGPGFGKNAFQRFAELMEDRDNVEVLIIEIERKSQEYRAREKEEKRRLKELKREAKTRRKALRAKKVREDHG